MFYNSINIVNFCTYTKLYFYFRCKTLTVVYSGLNSKYPTRHANLDDEVWLLAGHRIYSYTIEHTSTHICLFSI